MLCFETGGQEGHLFLPYSNFRRTVFQFPGHGNNRVSNALLNGIGQFECKIEAKFYAFGKIFILLYLNYFLICFPGKGGSWQAIEKTIT
jgi:hypothetical protein